MKEKIIKKLAAFDEETYQRIYLALSYDKRFHPFECYANSVDCWLTFKNKKLPQSIYNLLCKDTVKSWRIKEKLLIHVLFSKTKDYLKELDNRNELTQKIK